MRYTGAVWRGPTVNKTVGGMIGHIGLVLHVQQGTEAGTDSWFKNPAAQVSAHFGNPKTGPLEQWVDTDDRAWAEVAGNPYWVSVENEGNSGDTLTASQLENLAGLLAWLHATYSVPLQISDNPTSGIPGVTGHGLGGAAWGGHTDCPGIPILAARAAIIARAAQILGTGPTPIPTTTPTTTEDDMPVFATGEIPQDTGAHMVLVPPPNLTNGQWGNVWFSLGADFADITTRCAAYIHGVGWVVKDGIVVPAAGDRVNPWEGPLPNGTEKISVMRRTTDGVLGWLVEAAHR